MNFTSAGGGDILLCELGLNDKILSSRHSLHSKKQQRVKRPKDVMSSLQLWWHGRSTVRRQVSP